MRGLIILLSAALACLSPKAVAAVCETVGQSRPTVISIKTSLGTDDRQIYDGSYALVVGADNYTQTGSWPPLPDAITETKTIAKVLADQGFEVTRLCDPLRTGAGSLDDIAGFLRAHGTGANRVVVYLSGHGWSDEEQRMGYFAAVDSPGPGRDARDKGLSSAALIDAAKVFPGRHLLVLVDSCYSAMLFARKSATEPQSISQIDFEDLEKPVREFITAGSEHDQTPSPSIFAAAFLMGISGYADQGHRGFVRASELATWLRVKVANSTGDNTTPKSGIIPVSKDDIGLDTGDMVFVYDPSKMDDLRTKLREPGQLKIGGAAYLADVDRPVEAPISGLPDPKYQVIYFDKRADGGLVLAALEKARIPYVSKGAILDTARPTNGLACHPDADGEIVKAIARSLVAGGVHLRVIDQATRLLAKRRYAIEALRFERVDGPAFADLTLEDIEGIHGCPHNLTHHAAR